MIGTQFNYYDLSTIPEINEVNTQDSIAPLTISTGPTAKGPEELMVVSGTRWEQLFGAPNYKRYGQVSIQNQAIINAKAKILFKRIVAEDATLAASVVVGTIESGEEKVQVDALGNTLFVYERPTGENDDEGQPIKVITYVSKADVTPDNGYIYDAEQDTMTISGVQLKKYTHADVVIGYDVIPLPLNPSEKVVIKTIDDAVDYVETNKSKFVQEVPVDADYKEDAEGRKIIAKFPLFVITDNGRCASNKRFNIESESALSKNLDFMFYSLNIKEDGNTLESCRFSIIPNMIYNNECIDIDSAAETYLEQAKVKSFPDYVQTYIDTLVDHIDSSYENEDILFGKKRKGTAITGVTVDTEYYQDITEVVGYSLGEGSNGSFGVAPAENAVAVAYINDQTCKFFKGEITDEIYNLDVYQIDACFDADFDIPTKHAIAELVEYRKDFMYFRDYGTKCSTLDEIENYKIDNNLENSTWVADYCQAYDIVDPYTLKREKVTIMYDIAPMIINHLYKGRNLPFAGIRNNAIITGINSKKSLNFMPKVLPAKNEKDDMESLRVNFASYFNDSFVLESLYTSQEAFTQMSYLNNVLALQQVIKALRVRFPAERYAYITSEDDMVVIQGNINDFLSTYADMFAELEYTYIQDSKYLQNKIYRAAIRFRFNEFYQAELIDAYMLPSNIV